MKLHATLESERASRTVRKSADEFIEVELSAFGRKLGTAVLHTLTDAGGLYNMYIIKYQPRGSEDWFIIEEGHKTEGVVQRYEKLR